MNNKRPVNLDLTTIRFPVTAIISILHRISGVWLFLALPLLIITLHGSLDSIQSFAALDLYISNLFFLRFLIWTVLAAGTYHFVAGIRHMILDMGIGDSFQSGKKTAWIVLMISAILIVIEGVWLW